MAKSKQKAPAPPSSIEILGARLQKIINSPSAQKDRSAIIYKAVDELQEDWSQILEAIIETDGVYVTHLDEGGVKVTWDVPDTD